MKTICIVLFLVTSTIANSQIQRDKTLHFGAGILIGGTTSFISTRMGISDNKFETLLLSTSVSAVVGVGKEAYDKYVRKTFADKKDILWTTIGGFVGSVSVTYTIKPRNKNITPAF